MITCVASKNLRLVHVDRRMAMTTTVSTLRDRYELAASREEVLLFADKYMAVRLVRTKSKILLQGLECIRTSLTTHFGTPAARHHL